MRILILDPYYPAFLESFYSADPWRASLPYNDQWQALMGERFGISDSYSVNLEPLGHQAHEVIPNNDLLQLQWAREHRPRLVSSYRLLNAAGMLGLWRRSVLLEQARHFSPDIIYVQDMNATASRLLRELKTIARAIVGQIASPVGVGVESGQYDLIITSLPQYVTLFRKQGARCEYLQLAFDERVSSGLSVDQGRYDVSFIGGFTPHHQTGNRLLEYLAASLDISIWGYGLDQLGPDSPVRRRHHGEAWGLAMYDILASSKVTLNRHIDVAGNYANNMRLFEATGVGACLLTDDKVNLREMFQPDVDVAVYSSPEECAKKLRYLLQNDYEREAIARSGQKRTLGAHTYSWRMQQLHDILRRRFGA